MANVACSPCHELRRFSTAYNCSSSSPSRSSSTQLLANGELIRLPAVNFSKARCDIQISGAELGSTQRNGRVGRSRGPRCLKASSERFSSPKTGSVGADRFKDGALPGTYWDDSLNLGEEVSVSFNTGSKNVTVTCKAGDNLLKVAERSGLMIPTRDFCFEGSCCHCEMEVEGGAVEVGYRADSSGSDLVRSCICPVPKGRQAVLVNLWSDEDEWGASAL